MCTGVHFADVEWLGDIGGVRGMEVGHVCAVGVEWLGDIGGVRGMEVGHVCAVL